VIAELLLSLGVPNRFKGFDCLREAITLVLEDDRLLASVTKELYPKVGERCGLTASLVERNLRHLIEHTWTHGDLERLYEVFGSTVRANKGKPTNSSFIARLADVVRVQQVSSLG
jgi:two-component system response regulator (stage 0 sporulation protein A)